MGDHSDCPVCTKPCLKYSLQCDRCDKWFHHDCQEISVKSYMALSNIQNVWFCITCSFEYRENKNKEDKSSHTNSTTENKNEIKDIQNELKGLKESVNLKFDKLENILINKEAAQNKQLNEKFKSYASVVADNIEKNIVNNKIISSISTNIESVKADIETKMDDEKEMLARKIKEKNVCVFNIPESEFENEEKNYKDDLNKLQNVLLNKVKINKEDILDVYRKGYYKKRIKTKTYNN